MKLILAVSGGADSMTMADIMFSHSRLCPVGCEEFVIAHCNFNLRPGDCDKDEALVRAWAAERSIPFYSTSFDTTAYAEKNSCSIEVAARELRYNYFIKLCRELGYDGTATAHHADDNAETLLLNLLRGTGLQGICGMSLFDRMPYQDAGGELLLVRPLIKMSRDEIMAYVKEHHVPYRDDRSNFENEYRRNRLRNCVIPVLKELNPSFIHTAAADMDNFRMAAISVKDWEMQQLKAVRKDGDAEILDYSVLRECASPGQLINAWLSGKGFSRDSLLKITRTGLSQSTGAEFCGQGWKLYAGASSLVLYPDTAAENPEERVKIERMPYNGEGFGKDGEAGLRPKPGSLILDAARTGDYILRGWQEGDWFIPLGMKGRKKVSDWFTDIKAGANDKEKAVVLGRKDSCGGRISAILCPKACRQDESTRVDSGTESLLVVSLL